MVRKEGNVMSVGKRIYLKREMPDMEVMNQFKSIPASNTADVMGRSCAMNPRIRLVSSPKAQMMVGPAYTVKCRAGDNLALHAALSMCNEGDVIVVSNEEDSTRALIGEVMMAYLRYTKKVAGIVLDGPIRDIDEIGKWDFPVYCTGTTPGGPYKEGPGEVNVPIACGGISVNPGDIILAEPHALIGFAGPRVIEQTIGQKLPEGFQRSEFLLEHGFVDKIVERKDQKRVIGQILYMHRSHKMNIELKNPVDTSRTFVDKPAHSGAEGGKTAWDTVLLSRKSDRPVATDYINALFDEFIEFHGDRYFKDDGAIVGGVAMFHGMPVTVIGQQKGKNTKDNITRNFGMPSPDGYRKALRLMKQAETFGRPVICFVDTPGAFCGLEAEERGQGEAIARNLFEISDLKVPVLSIVIGEGGSGGALAMAVADEVWMLENAIYSILSPEGFASILYKDSKKAPDAAKVMKVTARDLLQLQLIERIVPEEEPACTDNLYRLAEYMDSAMAEFFKTYLAMSDEELREHRYQRFRRM